jgi:nitrogen fixation protein FixH
MARRSESDVVARLDIDARDAAGHPLTGMDATATFERPTDRRLDRDVTITEDSPGHFHGSAEIPAGQWDVVIELSRRGDREFRSKNRVVLR